MDSQQILISPAELEQALVRAVTAGLTPLIEELKADPPKHKVRGTFEAGDNGIRWVRDLSRLKAEEMKPSERWSEFVRAIYRGDGQRAIDMGGIPAEQYYRQMGEATGPAGGFLVPADFRAQVIIKLEKVPHIWQLAFHVPTGSDKLELPTEAGSVTWTWTAEGGTITASVPTLGRVVFTINTVAGLTKSSRQLLADSRVDIGDLLTTLYGRELGKELDKQFMTGDGSGKPLGIRNAGVTNTVAQAGANLAYGDVLEVYHKLPSQYRGPASFLLEDSRVKLIEKIVDAQGRPIFVEAGRTLDSIFGKPVLEQQDIPTNLGAGANESEIWIGDLNYFYIADREEMGLELSTEAGTAFETHQAWFKLWVRLDGRVALKDAFAVLTGVK